jgi:hypothetical protein
MKMQLQQKVNKFWNTSLSSSDRLEVFYSIDRIDVIASLYVYLWRNDWNKKDDPYYPEDIRRYILLDRSVINKIKERDSTLKDRLIHAWRDNRATFEKWDDFQQVVLDRF